MAHMGSKIFSLFFVIIMWAYVGFLGLQQLFNANTTGLPATIVTLGTTVFAIVVTVGVLYGVFRESSGGL